MNQHEKYMTIALQEAQKALSKGDFPVGCVIVGPDGVLAKGHRQNSQNHRNELDHAEILTLRKVVESGVKSVENDLVVYSTMEPCLMCFSTLILNNVRTIIYGYEDVMGGGTQMVFDKLPPLYREMDILVIPDILRSESLGLFQRFFNMEGNSYWAESLLCRYTLAQK
jgi:tRNA(adenine34) deaminase